MTQNPPQPPFKKGGSDMESPFGKMGSGYIPGTDFPLPVIERKGPPVLRDNREKKQRRGLLAKIHVAKKQMPLTDGEYEMILRAFKVSSAADMTCRQLENMVKLLKSYGWKPKIARGKSNEAAQLQNLRRRCVEAAKEIENGERRLAGLAPKICGVSSLTWCHDKNKLERLLAVLGKLKHKEEINGEENQEDQDYWDE